MVHGGLVFTGSLNGIMTGRWVINRYDVKQSYTALETRDRCYKSRQPWKNKRLAWTRHCTQCSMRDQYCSVLERTQDHGLFSYTDNDRTMVCGINTARFWSGHRTTASSRIQIMTGRWVINRYDVKQSYTALETRDRCYKSRQPWKNKRLAWTRHCTQCSMRDQYCSVLDRTQDHGLFSYRDNNT
ncbi:hypothetical protein J6590_017953 [Homalodisca vitripennis]|nr:hypothetical protein J6590_017953 [Homalodisca vitripennis]